MRKEHNIKGWGFEISLTFLRRHFSLFINPLVFNSLLICKSEMFDTSHYVFGPFHLMCMGPSSRGLIGLEFDFTYNHYWFDKPKCPPSYTEYKPFAWMTKCLNS